MSDKIYVTTKYFSATNNQGARIRVDHNGTRKTVPYDYAYPGDAHFSAVFDVVMAWGYTPEHIRQLCLSESGNGSVWEVTIGQ